MASATQMKTTQQGAMSLSPMRFIPAFAVGISITVGMFWLLHALCAVAGAAGLGIYKYTAR